MSKAVAVILAAGKSKRMKSEAPKVLHEICGRPMLAYVINAVRLAGVDRIVVVVGHGKDQVVERFASEQDLVWVEQAEQRGTGHAVGCCREALAGFAGHVLVVAGDMPLVRRVTLASLIQAREQSGDAVTLATTVLEDPTGYGRIIRGEEGRLEAIVEHRDCTEEQRAIREVNPSYYCFDARRLFAALEEIESDPQTGEIYITDAVRVLREQGHGVCATIRAAAEDAMGINSRLDLAVVGRAMEDRIQLGLMNEGVTIVDPDNTWIEADAVIGSDTMIYPFSYIGAGAVIGEGCRIGPFGSVARGETVPDGGVVGAGVINGVGIS